MNGAKYIAIRKAEEFTGLSQNTLRKMADDKLLQVYKTKSGQRRFNTKDLEKMCSVMDVDNVQPRINYIYTRVSTKKQLDDLERQIAYTKSRFGSNIDSYRIVSDIGSGINFQRKGLLEILDSCVQGVVGEIVVAHRDRLSRFAFELIEKIVEKSGGRITVLDRDLGKSTEQELAEDLLAIVHIYSCRQMGRRKYRTKTNQMSKASSETKYEPEENLESMVENKP